MKVFKKTGNNDKKDNNKRISKNLEAPTRYCRIKKRDKEIKGGNDDNMICIIRDKEAI